MNEEMVANLLRLRSWCCDRHCRSFSSTSTDTLLLYRWIELKWIMNWQNCRFSAVMYTIIRIDELETNCTHWHSSRIVCEQRVLEPWKV